MRRLAILCVSFLGASPAWVLAASDKAAPSLAASPLGGGVLLETAGGLLLILGLILGLGWLLRRFGRLPMAAKGDVSVLGGVSLGPRERAVLLQVGGARLLVGVAPGQVRTLHVLDPAELSPGSEKSFSERLEAEQEEQRR